MDSTISRTRNTVPMLSCRENWTENAWAAADSPVALAIHTQPTAIRMEAMVVPQAHSSLAAMCCQGVAGRLNSRYP